MRIVSLLPAATEWVCAFGAREHLVGRSHECDTPTAVQALPVVTRPAFDSEGDSAAIDRRVRDTLQQGLSLYEVDLERLRTLEPDLVLTQAQCEVCAVSLKQLEDRLRGWTGAQPNMLSMEPMTLKQVLDAGLRIGRAIGRSEAAMQFIARKEKELQALRDQLEEQRGADAGRPTVACIEWMDPLMTAAHWTPDVVNMAGGRAVLAPKSERSRQVSWEALRAADPDVVAIMPCGFTLEETARDLSALTGREGWSTLRAVREERIYVFDGNAYFNRPGPRLYRSIELMAAALHPTTPVEGKRWEMARLQRLEQAAGARGQGA